MKYPYDVATKVLDSAALVGLLLPLAVLTRVLDDGPAQLVVMATRPLVGIRLLRAAVFFGVATASTAGLAAVAPVPLGLVVADTALLSGLVLLAAGVIGVRLSWLVPMALVAIASSPLLIPWQVNLMYRRDTVAALTAVAATVTVVGVVTYAAKGSHGGSLERSVRRSDADVAPE